MKLFRIMPLIQGRSRIEDFLQDCFISIGYPGIGNIEDADAAEVSKRLNRVYGYEGTVLEQKLADTETFVYGMNDGDYVLVPSGGSVWLGDLGDYYYREDYDSPEEATCHRRGVTWLGVLPTSSLSPLLREFVSQPNQGWGEADTLAQFPLPTELAGLEAFAAQAPGGLLPGLAPVDFPSLPADMPEAVPGPPTAQAVGGSSALVDEATIRVAIATLKEALRSEDPKLRLRAAEALLRYAK